MSWDESNPIRHKCPCGRGTYTERFSSNDWGQSRTEWAMDCPSCKKDYVLHTYEYYHHGLCETGHRWIKKDIYKKANGLEKSAKRLIGDAVHLAQSRYEDRWLAHFKDKTKKEIWAELTRNGEKYPSLGTFYKHVGSEGMSAYLSRYFEKEHILDIFRILNISDDKILLKLTEADKATGEAGQLLSS